MDTRFHYVYRTVEPATGRFYIGKRSCAAVPERDAYLGSGVWVRAARRAGRELRKEVIARCGSEEEAYALEREFVQEARQVDRLRLCKNLTDGGLGLTSAVAKEVMNRPERRAIARATALRFNTAERVQRMREKTTAEQRRAAGLAGGSAGKGVSRNAGLNNPNFGLAPHLCPAFDATIYRLQCILTGGEWSGTKTQMRETLGASKHWYSLCSGKRKVCLGYRLLEPR